MGIELVERELDGLVGGQLTALLCDALPEVPRLGATPTSTVGGPGH